MNDIENPEIQNELAVPVPTKNASEETTLRVLNYKNRTKYEFVWHDRLKGKSGGKPTRRCGKLQKN